MTSAITTAIVAIVGFIGIVARALFYIEGRRSANARVEEDKAKRLSNRPRTADDVRERLRNWRKNQS